MKKYLALMFAAALALSLSLPVAAQQDTGKKETPKTEKKEHKKHHHHKKGKEKKATDSKKAN